MAFYYKYRSISEITRLLDIFINNRLYAGSYANLNDPMEGKFLYSGNSKEYKQRIIEKLNRMLICSLSKSYKNGLMWSHYADEHKGCCIEVEITAKSWRIQAIGYPDNLPNIDDKTFENDNDVIDAILFQKSKDWMYEHEIRCIKEKGKNTKPYLAVRITKLFLGIRMDRVTKNMIKKLVDFVNVGRKGNNKIEIYVMTKAEIDFGYNK